MSENEKKPAEMADIQDENLDEVAGGYIFEPELDVWEVIEEHTGKVLGTYSSREAAEIAAEELHQSDGELDWEDLYSLRTTGRHG